MLNKKFANNTPYIESNLQKSISALSQRGGSSRAGGWHYEERVRSRGRRRSRVSSAQNSSRLWCAAAAITQLLSVVRLSASHTLDFWLRTEWTAAPEQPSHLTGRRRPHSTPSTYLTTTPFSARECVSRNYFESGPFDLAILCER